MDLPASSPSLTTDGNCEGANRRRRLSAGVPPPHGAPALCHSSFSPQLNPASTPALFFSLKGLKIRNTMNRTRGTAISMYNEE